MAHHGELSGPALGGGGILRSQAALSQACFCEASLDTAVTLPLKTRLEGMEGKAKVQRTADLFALCRAQLASVKAGKMLLSL